MLHKLKFKIKKKDTEINLIKIKIKKKTTQGTHWKDPLSNNNLPAIEKHFTKINLL